MTHIEIKEWIGSAEHIKEEFRKVNYCGKNQISLHIDDFLDMLNTCNRSLTVIENITKIINNFESKDNREKGEWIIMGEYIKCNKCERLIKTESPDCYFYCPQCGRKMIDTEGLI